MFKSYIIKLRIRGEGGGEYTIFFVESWQFTHMGFVFILNLINEIKNNNVLLRNMQVHLSNSVNEFNDMFAFMRKCILNGTIM